MVGGASAALTGLLFVRCAELLIPDQRHWSLSVELIVTALLGAVVIVRVQPGRRAPRA
jgi:hypothetical protein